MANNPDIVMLNSVPAAPGIWTRITQTAQSVLLSIQTGQMMSVLAQMSDAELTQIGITRADIPRYAAELIQQN